MKQVELHYNPYLLKTKVIVGGVDITANNSSPFYKYRESRLQQWMEPRDNENWRGLLPQLRETVNDTRVKLDFYGTNQDYNDLKQLVDKDGKRSFSGGIQLAHKNADAANKNDPAAKLEELKKIYEQVKQGPKELYTQKVQEGFENALDDDFEIVVVAPMSSGKSTLLNALLGRDLLPAINQATTAVLTSIRDDDDQENFTVSAVNNKEEFVVHNEVATAKLIKTLNDEKDPNEPQKSFIKEIHIQGNIPHLSSRGLHTVFVDTPGGNNSLNEEHGEVMRKAIYDEDKSMVIYIFNGTQVSTNDNALILKEIANAMKRSMNGKQSRDRFIFVANRMDDVDPAKEPYEGMYNTILQELEEVGITNPNLYFVSARTAKLLRMQYAGEAMSRMDRAEYNNLSFLMTGEEFSLFEYSSLTEAQKEKFREEVKKLRAAYPESDAIPRVAEINSGIPALEMAINEYLEHYAIAIKLQNAQNAFMGAMRDEQEKGAAWRNIAKSEQKLKQVQREIAKLEAELSQDQSLSETVRRLEKITFDSSRIRRVMSKVDESLNSYANDLPKKVKTEEAEKLWNTFVQKSKQMLNDAKNEINDILENDIQKKCDEVMRTYRSHIEALRRNGLTEIGGIHIESLSAFKEVEENMRRETSMTKYTKITKEQRSKQVEKSGFGSSIARIFGSFFNTDWGWETVNYSVDVEVVDIRSYVRDQLSAKVLYPMQDEVKKLVDDAKKQVEYMKANAVNQSREIDKLVNETLNEVKERVKNMQTLKKSIDENRPIYEFSENIIKQVDKLLAIE